MLQAKLIAVVYLPITFFPNVRHKDIMYPKTETFKYKINLIVLTSAFVEVITMAIEITKITSKGQVVIPQDIREGKGIKQGERFIVYDLEDSIVLKRVKNLEAARTIDEFEAAFRSTWETAKKRGASAKDVEGEIAAHRKETSK